MALEVTVKLVCDICEVQVVQWVQPISKTQARAVAKSKYGWRVDKLNRDVCHQHPTLTPQRKSQRIKES